MSFPRSEEVTYYPVFSLAHVGDLRLFMEERAQKSLLTLFYLPETEAENEKVWFRKLVVYQFRLHSI